jgi:hypothetical protein
MIWLVEFPQNSTSSAFVIHLADIADQSTNLGEKSAIVQKMREWWRTSNADSIIHVERGINPSITIDIRAVHKMQQKS